MTFQHAFAMKQLSLHSNLNCRPYAPVLRKTILSGIPSTCRDHKTGVRICPSHLKKNTLASPVTNNLLFGKSSCYLSVAKHLSNPTSKLFFKRNKNTVRHKVCVAETASNDYNKETLGFEDSQPIRAAFFDVDGTIVKSNVVMQFVNVRLAELSPFFKFFWLVFFALKVPMYLLLDRIDRALFSRAFYANYEGRPVDDKKWMASVVFKKYMRPKLFKGAVKHIQNLKKAGFKIVLVTGSLDFLMTPLASELGVDHVFAAKLKEENGRLKGELEGDAMSRKEKASLVRQYASENGVSLKDSHAYGDSIADLSMLEEVGHPFAVRPDKRLGAIAKTRGWNIVDWLGEEPSDPIISTQT